MNEYMEAIMDWYLEMEDVLNEDELDRIDLTIQSVIRQMNWKMSRIPI